MELPASLHVFAQMRPYFIIAVHVLTAEESLTMSR